MTRKPPLPTKPTILKSTRPNVNVGKHGRLFHASRKPVGFTDTVTEPAAFPLALPELGVTLSQVPPSEVVVAAWKVTATSLLVLI